MHLKSFFSNTNEFVPVSDSEIRGYIVKKYDSQELRDALKSPDDLFSDAEIFKDSRTTKAGIAEVSFQGADKIFIKRFNNKGPIYTFRYIFRTPRPYRVCKSAYALKEIGVPTPEPIAVLSTYSAGFIPKNAYLIRRVVPDIVSTLEFFRVMLNDESLKHEYLTSVCRMFADMHNSGFLHGDAKCSNIYVTKNKEGKYSFGVWDLLSCRVYSSPVNKKTGIAEIARFANSFNQLEKRLQHMSETALTGNELIEIYEKNRA